MFGQFRDKRKIKIMGSNLMFSHVICRVLIWGVFHCRCERTQTQQAQYNEFGREAGLRTGPLRGLRQRSSRIANYVEEGWKSILGPRPRMSSCSPPLILHDEGLQVSSELRSLLHETSLVIYSSAPFILAIHLLLVQVATWVSVPSSASLNLLWVAIYRVTLFRGHSFINAARLPAAGI